MKASEAMSAINPIETRSSPQPASTMPEQRAYEPSMEEILASIRRIIADDQSLPSHVFARELEPSSRIDMKPDVPSSPGLGETPATVTPDAPLAAPERLAVMVQPNEEPPPAEPADGSSSTQPEPLHEAAAAAYEPQAPAPGVATLGAHMAHGSIDAPQFAMPAAPVEPDRHRAAQHLQQLQAAPVDPLPLDAVTLASAGHSDVIGDEYQIADDETLGQAEESPPRPGHVTLPSEALFSAATDSSVKAAFKTLAAARLADNADELLDIARDMIRPLLRAWIDNNLPSMVERLVRAEIERVSRGGR